MGVLGRSDFDFVGVESEGEAIARIQPWQERCQNLDDAGVLEVVGFGVWVGVVNQALGAIAVTSFQLAPRKRKVLGGNVGEPSHLPEGVLRLGELEAMGLNGEVDCAGEVGRKIEAAIAKERGLQRNGPGWIGAMAALARGHAVARFDCGGDLNPLGFHCLFVCSDPVANPIAKRAVAGAGRGIAACPSASSRWACPARRAG